MPGLARLRIVDFRPRNQRLEHIGQHLGVRTRRQGTLLRPAQLGRRDHLHGLGDLARVSHAANAPPDVKNIWHESAVSRRSLVVGQISHARLARILQHYFATACLSATNASLLCLIVLLISAFSASSKTLLSMIVRNRPGLVASTNR